MPYADQPKRLTHNAPHRGRAGKAYLAAVEAVRARVAAGARCWFWRKPGHDVCPGAINLEVRANTRWSFTAHHLQRLMDGGAAVVDAALMVPAHRACNARDGLMAQNAKRARARKGIVQVHVQPTAAYHPRPVTGRAGRAMGTHSDRGSDRQSRQW